MECDRLSSAASGTRLSPAGPHAGSVWDGQRSEIRLSASSDLDNLLGIYSQNRRLTDPDISNCSWQDVLEKMHEAQQSYQQKGQRSAIRGFFRHGQSIKMVFSPLLEVIPEDHGLKALKGGLVLLFGCLAKREENVEKILRCFEDVPLVIENAQETLDIFHGNPKLCDYVWGLHHALLTEIPHLIRVLLGKSDSKWWSRFLHKIPSEQEKTIADAISSVGTAKKKLTEYAETIGYRTMVDIQQITTKTAVGISEIQLNMREMSTDVKLGFWGLMQALQSISRGIDELREENAQQRAKIADIAKQNKCIHVMQTAVCHIGYEAFSHHLLCAPSKRLKPSPYEFTTLYDSYCLRQLCGRSAGPRDHLHATLDIQETLGKKHQFDEESIGRSRWLLTSRKFKDWLTVPDPGALVVHSYGDLSTEGKTSAMSVFCGTLASALIQQSEKIIVLSFFCGLHDDVRDGFSGPAGMLRSIMIQFLLAKGLPEPNRSSTSSATLMRDLEAAVPDALEYLFRQRAAQLPTGARVFCLIDAADVYDTRRNRWRDDLREAFRLLARLVYDASTLPSFKLLVTTPARSDTILQEMTPPYRRRLPNPAVDMTAGEVDNRPLTEEAIVADIRRLDAERQTPNGFRYPAQRDHMFK